MGRRKLPANKKWSIKWWTVAYLYPHKKWRHNCSAVGHTNASFSLETTGNKSSKNTMPLSSLLISPPQENTPACRAKPVCCYPYQPAQSSHEDMQCTCCTQGCPTHCLCSIAELCAGAKKVKMKQFNHCPLLLLKPWPIFRSGEEDTKIPL